MIHLFVCLLGYFVFLLFIYLNILFYNQITVYMRACMCVCVLVFTLQIFAHILTYTYLMHELLNEELLVFIPNLCKEIFVIKCRNLLKARKYLNMFWMLHKIFLDILIFKVFYKIVQDKNTSNMKRFATTEASIGLTWNSIHHLVNLRDNNTIFFSILQIYSSLFFIVLFFLFLYFM